MNREDVGAWLVVIMLVVVLPLFSAWCGYQKGRDRLQKESIEAGVAEWRIDPKTGEKRFEFIKPER